MNYILTAGLAAISMVFYNLFQKITPSNANPALALSVTYGVALVTTLAMFRIFPAGNLSLAFKNLNGASFALGVAIAGVEIATLLAYRSGWQISLLAISINVTAALILVVLGVLFFREKLSLVNTLGIFLSLAGLILINIKQ